MSLPRAIRAARQLLQKYGIIEPAVPVEDIANEENTQVAYHDLEESVSGLLIRRPDSAVIAVNVKHHEHRQRFTIAHELGHFILHQDEPTVFVDDLLVHFRADRGATTIDPREAEANAFAAALLMPEDFLRRDLESNPIDVADEEAVRRFARRYKVSAQALTIQLTKLGLISSF